MFLCGDVLYIQIKKWYVKFGATGSLMHVLRAVSAPCAVSTWRTQCVRHFNTFSYILMNMNELSIM